MKFFRVIGRSFRDALKSVGRNFSLSIASITCVMITLIIVGVALGASIVAIVIVFVQLVAWLAPLYVATIVHIGNVCAVV